MDGNENIRLLAFAFTIVFVWTEPNDSVTVEIEGINYKKTIFRRAVENSGSLSNC